MLYFFFFIFFSKTKFNLILSVKVFVFKSILRAKSQWERQREKERQKASASEHFESWCRFFVRWCCWFTRTPVVRFSYSLHLKSGSKNCFFYQKKNERKVKRILNQKSPKQTFKCCSNGLIFRSLNSEYLII